jgi:enoyl-CoA hydratase/carnithine racemase
MAEDCPPVRELLVEDLGPVRRLTLNRPQALNALTTVMLQDLHAACEQAGADDSVRVLLLTGAGRAFCAGADLKAFDAAQRVAPGEADFLERASRAFEQVRQFPKPVVAALNGLTMAGGLELAMCADIIVAAQGARIGDGHANYGVFPGGGGAAVLPRLLPLPTAMYLLLSGRTLTAERLHALGLVCELHPAEQLQAAALELAQELARRSPAGLRRMKAVARHAADKTREDALLHEQVMMREHLRSHDMAEGLSAFNERREPRFVGR